MFEVTYSIEGIIRKITINASDAVQVTNIMTNMFGTGKVQIINIGECKMEDLFKDIDKLEEFFNKNFIKLEEYMKIKSKIVDYYKSEFKYSEDDNDPPIYKVR